MSFVARSGCLAIVPSNRWQRTVCHTVRLRGIGLHTGETAEVLVDPAPEDYGIRFGYDGLGTGQDSGLIQYCGDNTTSVAIDGTRLQCIEHLLSCLHGLGITNAHLRLVRGSEVPIADGAALEIATRILAAGGWMEQRKRSLVLRVRDTIVCSDETEGRLICARPWPGGLRVRATIVFPAPIAVQHYSLTVTPRSYLREIAPARTFLRDGLDAVGFGKVSGERLLGLSAAPGSVALWNRRGFLSELRIEREQVRHKILDFLGDVFSLGLPVEGDFQLLRPGHSFTNHFCQRLRGLLAGREGLDGVALSPSGETRPIRKA